MRAIFAALVLSAALAFGCKAVPDGDDLDRLQDHVAALPDGLKAALSQWAANRIAYGYCLNHKGNDVGVIHCTEYDDGTAIYGERIVIPIEEMLLCLNRHLTTTYRECLSLILESTSKDKGDKFGCEWSRFESDMDPSRIPPEMDANRVTDDHIVDALLGPYTPPPAEVRALMGLPGFVGPRGVLCIQGVDWACADNPLDDTAPTTSASSGGGDR